MKMKGEFGSITDPEGSEYLAYELRFHTPSEHTILGKRYELEVQVLYKGVTKGDFFKQAGLAFLFDGKAGANNRFFNALDIMNLPDSVRKSVILKNNVNINHILFNEDNDFVDPNFNYYEYPGSISTPPCNEHMTWYIASKVRKVSTTQLTMLTDTMSVKVSIEETDDSLAGQMASMSMSNLGFGATARFNGNFREIQRSDTRSIRFFDINSSCQEVYKVPKPKIPVNGHFERVTKKITQYLHVSDDQPSGLAGALVISKKEAEGKKFLEE